jgi:signal transduction histidine kinase
MTKQAMPSLDVSAALLLADQVRELRNSGNLPAAIERCLYAIEKRLDPPFFNRILADLYFEKGDFEAAFVRLSDFLALAPPSQRKHFATRYARFRRVLPSEKMAKYASVLEAALSEADIDKNLANWALGVVRADLPAPQIGLDDPLVKEFLFRIGDDANFVRLAQLQKLLEEKSPALLAQILEDRILHRPRGKSTFRIDQFFASIYERWERYESAQKILSELLHVRPDPVATRSLFRISRITGEYKTVDDLLSRDPSLLKSDEFNILYELVYYFEHKDDFRQVQALLRKIESAFGQNLPVLRTVRNFYVRFGLLEDSRRMEPTILSLYQHKAGKGRSARFLDTLAESDAEVASKIQQLYSELEHQKQLAAISDLTTGISHELGQPITNIRYTIQFYRKVFLKRLSLDSVLGVFDSILEETKRMGGLISRLSPLTSSKSVIEAFDIMDRIKTRVQAENARLQEGKIRVVCEPNRPIAFVGDPVKFDQLMSNLLLNSIDAINERKSLARMRSILELSKQTLR